MSFLDDIEREDRALERADACIGCRQHAERCCCPTRLPVRLRLVTAEQPSDRERREYAGARIHHLPRTNDGTRALTPDAAA